MKKITGLLVFSSLASALDFGSLGSMSSSMGFSGVAVKNNDFALYYNPALIAHTKSSFAYGMGVSLSQKNLLELTSIDPKTSDNLTRQLDDIANIFSKQTNVNNGAASPIKISAVNSPSLNAATNDTFGNFGNVVDSFIDRNKNDPDFSAIVTSLENLRNQDTPTNQAALTQSINDLKTKMNTDNTIANKFKNELLQATDQAAVELENNGVKADLVKNIVSSIKPEEMLSLIDKAQAGDLSVEDITSTISEIQLSAFLDQETIKSIDTVLTALKFNELDFSLKNGFVYNHVSKDKVQAYSIGVFNGVYANTYAGLNQDKNEIIVKLENQETYVKIEKKSDGNYYIVNSTKDEFEAKSAFSTGTKNPLKAKVIALTEVPVGYASGYELDYGEVTIGGALKYIHGYGYYINKGIELDLNGADKISFDDEIKNPSTTHTFGVDLGILYTYEDFNIGLVGKYLNSPKINLSKDYTMKIKPQFRTGVSYTYKIATLALDYDLVANETLSDRGTKTQMIGGGLRLDFHKWFNLRGGLAYDLKNSDKGMIYTAGMGIFNTLDFSIAASKNTSTCSSKTCKKDIDIPNLIDFKLNLAYHW